MTTGRQGVKVPTTPGIPDTVDKATRDVLEAIVQQQDIREGRVAGGTNSRFVTIQDLIDAGIVADGVIK